MLPLFLQKPTRLPSMCTKDDAVVHITAKERETWNGKQDKLTDEAGNMTLDGGLTAQGGTFSDAVNANGGINIPLAAGSP